MERFDEYYDKPTISSLHSHLNILKQECDRHGFLEQSERVSQRIRDLNEPLLVMVVGEGNFGKSTLINALIGKDIAPVSILPKTWKVDLYEQANNKEEALLYTRQNPDEPRKVSIPEAITICEQEESKAKSMKSDGQSWKSDLYQVRWLVRTDWPLQNVALVDTPGFSQLRADTSISDLKLYGSNGIQMKASDAFEYYYYRADMVLWCINGNKVQDQDTLDALSRVHIHNKKVIGVLTKMDRIPSDRWNEVKYEAEKVFGKYISKYICTAAGAKDNTKSTTICELKKILNSEYMNNDGASKITAVVSYLNEESDTFLITLDSIMQCYINNIKKRSKIQLSTTLQLQTIHETTQNELNAVWKAAYNSAISQLDSIYDKAGGDVERYSLLVSKYCINQPELDRSINCILSNAQQRMQAEGQILLARLDWDGVRLGARTVSSFKADSYQAMASTINFRSKGELNLNLTSNEGVGAGIAVGGAAAAVGAFLLGPIGVAAGMIGIVAKKLMKRSKCTSEANSQISNFCDTNSSKINDYYKQDANKYQKQLNDLIEQSFICHHGKNVDGLINHSIEADNSLNALNVWPKNRNTAIWPRGFFEKLPNNYNPISCYYYNMSAEDSLRKKHWDEAVIQEWKDAITPYFIKNILDENGGVLNNSKTNEIKMKYHQSIKTYITDTVKNSSWEDASNGVDVCMQAILSNSSIVNDIRYLMPTFENIMCNVNSDRIHQLKAHTITDIKLYFEDKYANSMDNAISEPISNAGVRGYQLKRYPLGLVLSVIPFAVAIASIPIMWFRALLGIISLIMIAMLIRSYVMLNSNADEDALRCLDEYLSEVTKRVKALINNGFES